MSTTTENNYVSNGSTVLYSFTFPYINEADVKVSLNLLDTTAFTLSNATTVELDQAPASGVSIRIYRSTPTDTVAAEFFPGSAIRAQDLNSNFEQSLYVVQESQTIIENSDAASVVGIANEALATANQAKNTADSVSGTANDANTTAAAAETTANQALLDATTAQATAVAARTVADAALNAGSVLSDLSDVSTTPATTNQVLGWSGSTWGPVDQTGGGGGGGDTTINYNGASAWALTDTSGNFINGLNIASVTRTSAGKYDYVFATPMPSAGYSLVGSVTDASGSSANGYISFDDLSVNGFTVTTKDGSNSTTNRPHSIVVFSSNALPPVGGTGTDAWGAIEGISGNMLGSFNASSSKVSTGVYQITFNTPMPNVNYAPVVTSNQSIAAIVSGSIATTGFRVTTFTVAGAPIDGYVAFQVNATNATLPSTFTVAQFNDLVARVTALENA